MDRKMLRNWEHRFNEQGPDGLTDGHNDGLGERPFNPERLPRSECGERAHVGGG